MFRTIFFICFMACVSDAEPLRIAVASSMQKPMQAIAAAYTDKNADCRAEIIIGSSGKLTAQIINGAPYDVFISADLAYPNYLIERGAAAGPVDAFAEGELVLWAPDVQSMNFAILAHGDVRRIAIANPRLAPYGKAAVHVLEQLGLYAGVEHKLVYAEHVAQAVHFVKSGAADAGLVASSLIPDRQEADSSVVRAPTELGATIQHGLVVVSTKVNHACLDSFLSFMKSEKSGNIFNTYGYTLTTDEQP